MTAQRARSTYTDNVTRLGEDAMSAGPVRLVQAPQSMLATASEAQREMLSFMSMRLQKDSEVIREATSCRTFTDVTHLQFTWMQDAMRDYGEQTHRMVALCTSSAAGPADRKEP